MLLLINVIFNVVIQLNMIQSSRSKISPNVKRKIESDEEELPLSARKKSKKAATSQKSKKKKRKYDDDYSEAEPEDHVISFFDIIFFYKL